MQKRGPHRGPQAKAETGTKRFTLYPAEVTRELIRKAAAKAKQSVNQFVLLMALKAVAKQKNKPLLSLLPREEFDALVNKKYLWRKKK